MGLLVYIYKNDFGSDLNVFHNKNKIVVTNIEGPFQPNDDAPAARLTTNAVGDPIIVPDDEGFDGVQMMGGAYASTSDSRWFDAVKIYGAIPIHDRRESWADYQKYNN